MVKLLSTNQKVLQNLHILKPSKTHILLKCLKHFGMHKNTSPTRRRRGSYRHIHHDTSPSGIVPTYTSRRVADGDRTEIYVTTRRRRGSYRHIHRDASPTGIVLVYTSRRVADWDRTDIYITTRRRLESYFKKTHILLKCLKHFGMHKNTSPTRRRLGSYRHIHHDASPTGIVPAYTSRRVADWDRTDIYITTRRRRGSYRHIHHDASPTGIVPAYTSRRVADGDRTGIYITTRCWFIVHVF